MHNRKIIKFISVLLLITSILCFINNNLYAKEFSIEKADLYSKGKCKSLLINIPTGGTIVVTKVFYKNNGKEYPAYCLNKKLDGVGEVDDYSVTIDKMIDNQLVRRVIINGYPYKSLESLGVKDVDEAFTATKMAVYCILYDYNIDKKFKPIGEAGKRTIEAMKTIIKNAENTEETPITEARKINKIDSKFKQDNIEKNYASKT